MSARGNALAVSSSFSSPALLRALNGIDPAIWFTAARTIPEDYRVRGAVRRIYRYFEAPDGKPHDLADAATALFSGTVDVRSFGRGLPSETPVLRLIEAVTVQRSPDGGRTLEVRAPSFVWGEVRKIVAALREVDAGRLDLDQLRAALAGENRLTLPTVAPEPLVLWEVEYLRALGPCMGETPPSTTGLSCGGTGAVVESVPMAGRLWALTRAAN